MTAPLIETARVTGDAVQPGDIITVGGLPHTVIDVRELANHRKRLQFADGNAYVLGPSVPIEVMRVYPPRHGSLHTPQHPRPMTVR